MDKYDAVEIAYKNGYEAGQRDALSSGKMKIKLDPGAYMPERAHEADAGYDLRAMEDATIFPNRSHTFNVGVHVQIPRGYVAFIKSKSGLNINHNIVTEGVIDSGYTGSIRVKLNQHTEPTDAGTSRPYSVHRGDKIAQLVILPILTPELEVVDQLDETERGDNGFGSSGR